MIESVTEQKKEENKEGDIWNSEHHWVIIVCYDRLGNFRKNEHETLNHLHMMEERVESNTTRDH
jgi:hypothetical protein